MLCSKIRFKADKLENLNKALWSCTHIAGLTECEMYWPKEGHEGYSGSRNALVSRLDAADMRRVTDLACWVWEERFLRNGFEHQMGGWIFLDMIQVTKNCRVIM